METNEYQSIIFAAKQCAFEVLKLCHLLASPCPLFLHKFLSFYCQFEGKRLIINFHWLGFCLKSFYELHMSVNGFM